MKDKIKVLLVVLITIFLGLVIYNTTIPNTPKPKKPEKIIIPVSEVVEYNYEEYINNLKTSYGNNDIVAVVQIPNVLEEVVVQTKDNDYYLKHDIHHNYDDNGTSFLDYRNNIRESKKLLIYGHSDPYGILPFVKLTNYNDKKFMEDNPYVYIIDKDGKREYEVFSSYIETQDFDYVNLESFSGLTYQEHLNKLRKKSFVKHDIELTDDSKVLVLQTCSFDSRVSAKTKFQIVVAKEVDNN